MNASALIAMLFSQASSTLVSPQYDAVGTCWDHQSKDRASEQSTLYIHIHTYVYKYVLCPVMRVLFFMRVSLIWNRTAACCLFCLIPSKPHHPHSAHSFNHRARTRCYSFLFIHSLIVVSSRPPSSFHVPSTVCVQQGSGICKLAGDDAVASQLLSQCGRKSCRAGHAR